ncbi:hypothetical protein [Sulfurisoma sediminicola]|uniref:Uncharacterized protein n=1 Tax=Sulfurisoma sediminicola TaxID=1381557 RepID=A0A497XK55_9PROT|nr:hypothetical protein [Sulfurisoma sediminicola]RLJ68254.1 hypothetical protein DFR35_0808 [Sulfurisoma sediminicola]
MNTPNPGTSAAPDTAEYLRNPPEFSLVVGGPLFQMLSRAHMWGEARDLQAKRMLAAVALTWLPLFLLAALGGELWGGEAEVPFLKEVAIHVRFLVAVPLLIAAEIVVHRRMRLIVTQFLDRKLIPDDALERFEAAVDAALRLRNSVAAEVLLIVIVYVVGYMISSTMGVAAAGWRSTGQGLTAAGFWYVFVSLPVFQFLLLRWYFRVFIWIRFLWQVSSIRLNLVPTHPDRLGGLAFLTGTLEGFVPLAVAQGALLAGLIADRIFHLGATLLQFKIEIGVAVVFVICLLIAPLLLFSPQLAEAKRKGRREYGTLAQRYVREFDEKWLRGGAPVDEPLMGSGDIQSLADLGNSYEVVRTMRVIPVTRDSVVMLAVATLLPVAPLLLTMMPLEELLKKALALVF